MLTLRRGYVGTAPGTTTLYMPLGQDQPTVPPPPSPAEPPTPPEALTYEQYLAQDIALRKESLVLQKRGEVWSRIGTFATASLTTLALLAALGAWWRTGKLKAVPR